eukprot:8694863-Prorocentrum_lima.AAC.1
MTSSLVGSEMCIRDRQSILPRMQNPIGSCQQGCPHSGIGCIHVRQEGSTCLLYTSDAADDM